MIHSFLTDDDSAALSAVFSCDDNRFTTLVQTAGLDPARDLRHLNLQSIVLQPGEDIAGYDFTGCDLTGAVMRRVDLSGAVFTGAETAGMDCRGSTGLETALSADQRSRANVAPLPKALQYGPNRHWPEELAEEIERILQAADTASAFREKAQKTYDTAQFALAEALYRILLDWDTADLGPEAPLTLSSVHTIASAIVNQGRAEEAETAFAALLAIREEVQGPEHWGTLATRHNLAYAILAQGRAAEAEAAFAALLPIREKVEGPEDPDTLTTRHELARAILEQGRAAEAEAAFAALLPIYEKVQGPEHPDTLTTRHNLAVAILDQGRAAEAEAAFAALLPIREKVQGSKHPGTLATRRHLAWACLELGEAGRARDMLAPLPEEGGDPDLSRIGQTFMLRGWLADLDGAADVADGWLARAAQALAEFRPEHYMRRRLARYLETRVPGAPGGTWIPADLGVGDGVDRGRVGAPADT